MAAPALSDPDGRLGAQARADVEAAIARAAAAAGSPVAVEIVGALPRGTDVAALARRRFAARALAAAGADPVLLVAAVHDHAAAIETGKDIAGIVPEVDARRIVARLDARLHHQGQLAVALGEALDAIGASAADTAARRRPLPPEPPPPGAAAAEAAAAAAAARAAQGPILRGRSRLPFASAIAVLLVLALALRRRRQVAAARGDKPRPR